MTLAGTWVNSAVWGMFDTLVSLILLGLDNRVVPCWGYIQTLRYKSDLGQSLLIVLLLVILPLAVYIYIYKAYP